jgi:hypothetical protein
VSFALHQRSPVTGNAHNSPRFSVASAYWASLMAAELCVVRGWMPFSPVNLSWSTRCTNSDVMSTTVTTKAAPAAALRRAVMSLRGGRGRHMNLPTRSVSAVPQALPHSKRCQLLIKERDEFMAMLKAERDERERRERTSATRIQVRPLPFWAAALWHPAPQCTCTQRATSCFTVCKQFPAA